MNLLKQYCEPQCDLLWSGGIGTFVKAGSESNSDVGDKTNDGIRIDAHELHCKVIGEGANLGLTQMARVEYVLDGGLVYTDFIDNSGGVDCSDHEVNIKILLIDIVADGDMTEKQRNALLADMTDEVADLVLHSNYKQAQAISVAANFSTINSELYVRYIDYLEKQQVLERSLEFLPNEKVLMERKLAGKGLTAPAIAVLLSYSKILIKEEILDSAVPEDPYLSEALLLALPLTIPAHAASPSTQPRLRNPKIAISDDVVILSYAAHYNQGNSKEKTSLEYIYGRIKYSESKDELIIDWDEKPHEFLSYAANPDKIYPYLSASITKAREVIFVGSLNQSLYAKSGKISIDKSTNLPSDNLENTEALTLIEDTSGLNIRSVDVSLLVDDQENTARGVVAVRKRSKGDKYNVLYMHGLRVNFTEENKALVNNIYFYNTPLEYDKGLYPAVTIIEQTISRGGQPWIPVLELHKDSSEITNNLYANYGELSFEDNGKEEALKIMGDPSIANMANSKNKGINIGTISDSNTPVAISATADGHILLSQVCYVSELDKSGRPEQAWHICSQWATFSNPNLTLESPS